MQSDDLANPGRAPETVLTARSAGLVACRRCALVYSADASTCRRCGNALSSRSVGSLQRVWAWLIAGFITYIPANTYPMLTTVTLGHSSENTLLGGVVELFMHGSYGVAAIVFVASIVIPIGKFIAIAYLALSLQWKKGLPTHSRHMLHETVEFIGRWSMIDVFVVAILSALVQLGATVSVSPGIAAVSFALSVAFTMLAAMSFDSRLIWDSAQKDPQ